VLTENATEQTGVQVTEEALASLDAYEGPKAAPTFEWPAGNAIERLYCLMEIMLQEISALWKFSSITTLRPRWIEFLQGLPTSELERYLRIPREVREVMMTYPPEAAWKNFRDTMEEVEAASGKRESAR
jgi:hypothetical protein